MTPSHANKKGVRYRYCVSQTVLQNRKEQVGSVTRVSAPDVEALVIKAIRVGERERCAAKAASNSGIQTSLTEKNGLPSLGVGELSNDVFAAEDLSERDLLIQYVTRVVGHKDSLGVILDAPELDHDELKALGKGDDHRRGNAKHSFQSVERPDADRLSIPFAPNQPLVKGIAANPSACPSTIDSKTRETLLLAIARAHVWMASIMAGGKHLDEIAAEEQLAERYLRRILPLAFLSPKIITAIDNGTAPAGLIVSRPIQSLPTAWVDQERMIGTS
jgi:hypothetical protein